ncbi:MAG: SDR family NAD(P)-dependent oxidoreductase [Sandaracinus sp.]|nr:SDR family NAD(P)-dependent oxidoreductase [Sandaracinus sp.]MCB9613288.1 SDR family NAD(P)-dependent oxidoreductase [Sandaracinus sp.]MCB9624249.1 SDR family NAD(P)-dependent oxidoreductase [Sandaracinus sp.]MCB9634018.1 SDR family NAD(P)-dependent oxidoreductase [Sandaracinus sp.]
MSLSNPRVVVTGGGGALGVAVVKQLLAKGAKVFVPAHSDRDAKALAGFEGVTVAPSVDLSDEAAVVAFYESVGDGLWGSVHIAGGFVWGPIVDASHADLRRMLSMNVESAWLCAREAARRMTGGGRIVNVAAKPALVPSANVAAYAASKGAVATLTLCLAEELAPRGIWVNAVAPSIMDTPANRASMPEADFDAWPKVDEVAATIGFLASKENAVTRGAIVPVYGRS